MTRSTETAASDWVARRDAGLTASDEAAFRAWLADPDHARAFARHEKTFRIFARPAQVADGPALAREIRTRVARKRKRRIAAVTGAVSALLLAGLFYQTRLSLPPHPGTAIVVRPAQRTLPDGTAVELRSDAEIAVAFTADGTSTRRVQLLKGEAHFQVAKNPSRPFIVEVNNVEVRAVGTAFTVQRTSAQVEVVVNEGIVALDRRPSTGPADAPITNVATLNVGDKAIVDFAPEPKPTIAQLAPAELADHLAWRTPRLEFTGTRLDEAVALVNQHDKVKFEVADDSLNSLEVSGYFRAGQPDTFLLLLEQSDLGIRGERRGDTIILRKAR